MNVHIQEVPYFLLETRKHNLHGAMSSSQLITNDSETTLQSTNQLEIGC